MDGQAGLATKQELDFLQTQMKNVYATQAEHADRLARLEQRVEPETRSRTPWGTPSPFSGLLHGNSQPGTPFNPAAEAFRNFDQDQSGSLTGSLHLDSEEEPRRGASRANSVRFDENTIHGHFGHNSRSINELPPSRTGSAFGSLPFVERSISHKSDGRHSSTHSARASSIGAESRPLSATVGSFMGSALPPGTSPGLLILGPAPSIIRCWLDDRYSNDTLLYASICTGSYKSWISQRIVNRLGFAHQVRQISDGNRSIKLPVYLAEATIQQAGSRSASPAPQLPTITADFIILDLASEMTTLDIFLGCDVLRKYNADIHFSLDRVTMLDDEQNKVSIPLARPENAALFQGLRTLPVDAYFEANARQTDHKAQEEVTSSAPSGRQLPFNDATVRTSNDPAPTSSPERSPSVAEYKKPAVNGRTPVNGTITTGRSLARTAEHEATDDGTTIDTSSRTEANHVWGSWRRDSNTGSRGDPVPGANMSSAFGHQRVSRSRGGGMKVLKPARLHTSRTPSSPQPTGFDAMAPRSGDMSRPGRGIRPENESPTVESERKASGGDLQPLLPASAGSSGSTSGKAKSSNPIGGASAFGWLNSGGKE